MFVNLQFHVGIQGLTDCLWKALLTLVKPNPKYEKDINNPQSELIYSK